MNLVRMLNTQSTIFLTMILLLAQTGCGESQSATASYFGGLELKTEANHLSLKTSESVQVRFTATNTGPNPIIIDSKDTPVLDLIVEEIPSRRKLTSWTDQNPNKVSHRVEWQPGESKVMELTWTYSGEEHLYADFEGTLNKDSRMVQAATVRLCLEPCRY